MEREITRIIEEVDKDKNGQIDYDEFCDMMQKSASTWMWPQTLAQSQGGRGEGEAYLAPN